MEETMEINLEDLEAQKDVDVETDLTTSMVVEENSVEDISMPAESNNGNLWVLILVVVVCSILGLILGIWRGKKAANK